MTFYSKGRKENFLAACVSRYDTTTKQVEYSILDSLMSKQVQSGSRCSDPKEQSGVRHNIFDRQVRAILYLKSFLNTNRLKVLLPKILSFLRRLIFLEDQSIIINCPFIFLTNPKYRPDWLISSSQKKCDCVQNTQSMATWKKVNSYGNLSRVCRKACLSSRAFFKSRAKDDPFSWRTVLQKAAVRAAWLYRQISYIFIRTFWEVKQSYIN